MLLFIISVLLIFTSSFLIASFSLKKSIPYSSSSVVWILYFLLAIFAQIVLAFEALSLLKAISQLNFICCNFVFLLLSFFLSKKYGHKLPNLNLNDFFYKLKNAMLLDKSLIYLGSFLFFFLVITFLIIMVAPVNSFDALGYHLARVPFWLSNGNLSHFDTADIRMLVMPINSELLYSWVLLFLENDWALGIFSFVSLISTSCILFGLMSDWGFSMRRKLWTLFVFSSFASIVVESSSVETDLLLGALVLSSVFLFYKSLVRYNAVLIFYSALSYALAIGTKTPALFVIPGIFILFLSMNCIEQKKIFNKQLFVFVVFLFINVLLFASYNYILNFIHFGNITGSYSVIEAHKFFGGLKAFVANFIRYIFLLFDFSGLTLGPLVSPLFELLKKSLFIFLNIPDDAGVIINLNSGTNSAIRDAVVGLGPLGFIVFLPCLFRAIFASFARNASRKRKIMAAFAAVFFLNIVVLSFSIGFMTYSVRFLTFFFVLSSVVIAYSYIKSNKNILKWIIIYFSFSYLVVISTHLPSRPFFKFFDLYKKYNSIYSLREAARCSESTKFDKIKPICLLKQNLLKDSAKATLGFFAENSIDVYSIKMMENNSWNVDNLLMEKIDSYNLDKYDYIVTFANSQSSDYILNKKNTVFSNEPLCTYFSLHGRIISQNSSAVPSIVKCDLDSSFFARNGFYLFNVIKGVENDTFSYNDLYIYKKKFSPTK